MGARAGRGGLLLLGCLLAAVACAGCGELQSQQKLGPPRPLTVAIDGAPSALYAALYTAAADGQFARGALSVKIARPPGSGALAALESRAAAVAIVSEPALLGARERGAALVAIGSLVRQPLDAIVSLAGEPIVDAAALRGRTIALLPTALAAAELQTALAGAHVAASSVREVTAGGNLEPMLRGHQVSATLGDAWPLDAAALAIAHQPAKVLGLPAAGVPTFAGLVIVVRVDEAHDDGPLLRAFLQSLTRGERAAAADPTAAAAALHRANPALSIAFERAALKLTLALAAPADAANPFGFQNPTAWQAFGDWMLRHGLIPRANDADLAITDEFLPGQGE